MTPRPEYIHDDEKTPAETPVALNKVLLEEVRKLNERFDGLEGRIVDRIVEALAPAQELKLAVKALEARIVALEETVANDH